MRFNKIVSGLLAGALAVTSVFAGNVTTVKAEGTSETPKYSFDFNREDLNTIVSSDNALSVVGTGNAASTATPAFADGRSGQAGDKSVKLGSYALSMPANIGENYTVNVWVKSNKDTIGNNNAIFLLGINSPEEWVGFAGSGAKDKAKVWGYYGGGHKEMEGDISMVKGQWTMLTFAQAGGNLEIYQDGVLKSSHENVSGILQGDAKKILLGTTYWTPDGLFDGWVDDVSVYDKKLTASQIYKVFDPREEADVFKTGTLTVSEKFIMVLGSGEKKKVAVTPMAGVNPEKITYSYESSAPAIAAVDAATGEITAVKAGTATITTKAVYNNDATTAKTAQTEVLVKEPASSGGSQADPFTKINRTAFKDFTVGPRATSSALANAIPAEVKNLVTVEYTSSNPGVAAVNKTTGVVTGVKAGYTIITTKVKAKSDGFEMEYQTVVKVDLNMKGITVSASKTSLAKGEKAKISVNLPAAVKTAVPAVTYKTTGAVSVKNGQVSANKAGSGTVIVKVKAGGKSISKKLKFNVGDITGASKVKVKKSITLKVTGISGKATWSLDSKGKKLASINKKTGKLTAKKKTGKVTVTAKVGKVTMKKTIKITKK